MNKVKYKKTRLRIQYNVSNVKALDWKLKKDWYKKGFKVNMTWDFRFYIGFGLLASQLNESNFENICRFCPCCQCIFLNFAMA